MSILRHSAAALGAALGAPLGALALALRPGWRPGWRERLGGGAPQPPGAVWVHGASVGEILAALPLMDRLRARGHAVSASTTTVTGRDVLRGARPDWPCTLAPLDHPWCVDAALRRVAPSALVLVETELWPSWIAAAERRGVPVLLVSARLSDRSFPRYARLRPLLARLLRRLSAIGARTELDRERFVALGADPSRVQVTGDLKLDFEPPPPLAPDLDRALSGGPLLVAGSTHRGEEAAALDALAAAEKAGVAAALLLAPRRPDRAGEAERTAREAGRRVGRRSALGDAPLAPGEVIVLDTLGELAAVYARAAVAFVGGTLVPVGGHNLLEPGRVRRPVLFGPHTANAPHAAALLEACGGGRSVADAAGLATAAAEWLADGAAASAAGERAWQALQAHRGAAERAADLVDEVLDARAAAEG